MNFLLPYGPMLTKTKKKKKIEKKKKVERRLPDGLMTDAHVTAVALLCTSTKQVTSELKKSHRRAKRSAILGGGAVLKSALNLSRSYH